MRCSASGRVHGRICGSSNLATNWLGAAEISSAQCRSPIGYSFSDAQNWRRVSSRTGARERFRGRGRFSERGCRRVGAGSRWDRGAPEGFRTPAQKRSGEGDDLRTHARTYDFTSRLPRGVNFRPPTIGSINPSSIKRLSCSFGIHWRSPFATSRNEENSSLVRSCAVMPAITTSELQSVRQDEPCYCHVNALGAEMRLTLALFLGLTLVEVDGHPRSVAIACSGRHPGRRCRAG